MLAWTQFDEAKPADHLLLWSRVDYLLAQGPEKAHAFLMALKEPLEYEVYEDQYEPMHARQLAALKEVYDLDPATFDERWSRYVLKSYPKR